MSARRPRGWAKREARAADEALLAERLAELGGPTTIGVHENRTVLVSVSIRGVLRVHRGYAYAPDRVLKAVLTFVNPAVDARERRVAERCIVEFPVETYVRPPRPRRCPRPAPGDRRVLTELNELHARLNRERFGGTLGPVRFRLSDRMRRRLGELTVDSVTHRVVEIAISRRHLERDSWDEVAHTVLHEMVHQWQAEAGLEIDHGPTFRRKAREVGAIPRADRIIGARRAARMN